MHRPIDVPALFGTLDIYLFDQLQRGRIAPGQRILDAGCGAGRNLHYFLQAGYDVQGTDQDAAAISAVRLLAARLAPALPPERFRQEPVEHMSIAPASVDVVVSSAVLHFARDRAHFDAMLAGSWRPLAPGGLFVCRLASRTGIERDVVPLGEGRYRVPDGSERFLVDVPLLEEAAATLGGELLDPIRTTLVHGQRAMATWVLRRRR